MRRRTWAVRAGVAIGLGVIVGGTVSGLTSAGEQQPASLPSLTHRVPAENPVIVEEQGEVCVTIGMTYACTLKAGAPPMLVVDEGAGGVLELVVVDPSGRAAGLRGLPPGSESFTAIDGRWFSARVSVVPEQLEVVDAWGRVIETFTGTSYALPHLLAEEHKNDEPPHSVVGPTE